MLNFGVLNSTATLEAVLGGLKTFESKDLCEVPKNCDLGITIWTPKIVT